MSGLHTGDPCLYGAIKEQMDELERLGIGTKCAPASALFARQQLRSDAEYTLPGISQSVVITRMAGRTPVPEKESIRSFAAHGTTMVIFLSTGMLKELSEELISGGYEQDTPAAIVYKASWPGGKSTQLYGKNIGADCKRGRRNEDGAYCSRQGFRWKV